MSWTAPSAPLPSDSNAMPSVKLEQAPAYYPYFHHTHRRENGETIAKVHHFDVKCLVFQAPRSSRFSGFLVPAKYHLVDPVEGIDEIVPVNIQSPFMRAPFGMSNFAEYEKKKKETDGPASSSAASSSVDKKEAAEPKDEFQIQFSYGNPDYDPQSANFLRFMAEFDAAVLALAYANKAIWYQDQDMTDDIVRFLYTPMARNKKVKRDADGNPYPPMYKVKVPARKKVIQTHFFDQYGQPCSPNAMRKGCEASSLSYYEGIWVGAKGFSNRVQAKQVMISGNTDVLPENVCSFVTESSKVQKLDTPATPSAP
jgi:hypothetical protein